MRVIVVDDTKSQLTSLRSQLEHPGTEVPVGGDPHIVTVAESLDAARKALDERVYDYAFIDLVLNEDRTAGRVLLDEIVSNFPSTICIMMSSNSADDNLEYCLKKGAADYIIKPFDVTVTHNIMRKARIVHRLRKQNIYLRANTGKGTNLNPIWLNSKNEKFKKILDDANKLKGKNNFAIFISGESGVGKEVMAKFLWTLEEDETRPFVAVHTGALPAELVESELFGHKKGTFTGAIADKMGKFEAADGGDIFLDEVATMLPETQAKLLRVLQEREIVPLGSGNGKPKKIDIRVISATNEDIGVLIKKKLFREDLYYRLRFKELRIPPLRERREDLDDLIEHFLRKSGNSHKKLSAEARAWCDTYRWPGNIRELENALTVSAELSEGDVIGYEDLASQVQEFVDSSEGLPHVAQAKSPVGLPFGLSEDDIKGNFNKLTSILEKGLASYALKISKSNKAAADFLGLNRTTLESKIKRFGLRGKSE